MDDVRESGDAVISASVDVLWCALLYSVPGLHGPQGVINEGTECSSRLARTASFSIGEWGQDQGEKSIFGQTAMGAVIVGSVVGTVAGDFSVLALLRRGRDGG